MDVNKLERYLYELEINEKWKRGLIVAGIVLASMIVVVITCISFIAESLIEKYDVKYTGREIEMDWMFVNLFTGYVHFDDLTIYENQSGSVFFKVNGLSVDEALNKFLSKMYTKEISPKDC